MNDADRRIHPRHAFDRAVFCYHDGTRVSGKPIDISIGGMLFASAEVARVQKGTQLGVVFDRSCGIDPPVYLLARVARIQTEPVKGVGLRWIKATSAMEAQHLAAFLEILFGISASVLLPTIGVGQGRMRSTFEFENFLRAVVDRQRAEQGKKVAGEPLRDLPPPRASLRDPEAGPIGLITRPEEVDALKVEVVRHEQGYTGPSDAALADELLLDATGAAPRKRAAVEPVAPRAVERPVPADLDAILEVGTQRLHVRIAQIGPAEVFVRTVVGPVDIDGVYPLRFAIATREGDVTLTATTRISEVRTGRNDSTPGLELEIIDLDEVGHSGLLSRYVRWLQSGTHGRA